MLFICAKCASLLYLSHFHSRSLRILSRVSDRSNDRSTVSITEELYRSFYPHLRRFEKTYSYGEISDCRSPYPPINNVKHAAKRHWALTLRSLREPLLFLFFWSSVSLQLTVFFRIFSLRKFLTFATSRTSPVPLTTLPVRRIFLCKSL